MNEHKAAFKQTTGFRLRNLEYAKPYFAETHSAPIHNQIGRGCNLELHVMGGLLACHIWLHSLKLQISDQLAYGNNLNAQQKNICKRSPETILFWYINSL